MSVFSRLSRIVAANLNALLDRAENLEVMLDAGVPQARFRELEERLSRSTDELIAEAGLYDLGGIEAEFVDGERQRSIDQAFEALSRERELSRSE